MQTRKQINDARPLAALYGRVSTTDQSERYSLPSQLKALREKAAREGFTVREDWIFKDTCSGKLASRPNFDRLNALVATGMVGAVFVFSVDRLARKTMDALKVAAEYKRHGVRLDFVEMPYEDTPTGRFTFTQLASFAELWGEKILADSARGRKQKLESGKLTSGSAKYGYRYIPKREKDGARLVIDSEKAEIVRSVFAWRLEGMSMYSIAKRLNEAGILSAGSSRHTAGLWSRVTVHQLLHSTTYIGKHICSGIEVPCPAIISEEVFSAAQRITEQNRVRLVGRPSNKYLLRGFLFCKKCGRRCITYPGCKPNGSHMPFYVCGNIEYKPYKRICRSPQVHCAKIEAAAWKAVWSVVTDPALLMKLAVAFYDAQPKPESAHVDELAAEATRLRQKIVTTRTMMQDSLIDYAKGKADIRAAEGRVHEIEAELAATGRVYSLPPVKAAEAAVRQIADPRNEPKTYDQRRSILEGIVDLKLRYFDGDLEITGSVPVPAASASASGSKKNCYSGVAPNSQRDRTNCR